MISTPVTRSVCPRRLWIHSSVEVLNTFTLSPEAHRRNLKMQSDNIYTSIDITEEKKVLK